MSLTFKNSPLYLQISQDLRQKIRAGFWVEGQKIPTDVEMCELYHVSRITVRKAIDELVRDNLIIRKKAKGSFVTTFEQRATDHYTSYKSFTNEMKEVGIDIQTLSVELSFGHADYTLARYLNVTPGEKILILKRVRGANKKKFAYFVTYLKLQDYLSTDEKDYLGSLYAYLKSQGVVIKSVREIVEAGLPNNEVAKKLGITQKTPILKRTRIINNTTISYYEFSECYYIGSEYKYFIDFDEEK